MKSLDTSLAPVSDNPLDAPAEPRPKDAEAEEDAEQEDEEMGEADEEGEEANGGTKEGTNGVAPTTTETTGEGQEAQTKASVESSARSNLVAQQHAVIVPSYARWFEMDEINKIERKALPEFFNNRNRSKTPAVYRDYRDFMVNTYRLNPNEYLTVTACRRNLAGDVCAIMRVHAFLEQWGLINYQVGLPLIINQNYAHAPQIDPASRPATVGPPFTGHFRVTADTPRGLQTFQPTPNAQLEQGKAFKETDAAMQVNYKEALKAGKANLDIRRNIYDSKGKDLAADIPDKQQANGDGEAKTEEAAGKGGVTDKQLEEIAKEPRTVVYCNSCGIDCSRISYHNVKNTTQEAKAITSSDLCPPCFAERRFGNSSTAQDYVRREDTNASAIPDRHAAWTDSETLLLLEGLEKFDENWNSIADHVGTRTREECVIKFLKLEIEDQYLEEDVGGPNYAGLESGRVPFSQADNPVFSVLGYLAGLSDPSVAAAAGNRAIDEQTKRLRKRLENGIGGTEEKDDEPTHNQQDAAAANSSSELVKTSDSMDVDNVDPPTALLDGPVTDVVPVSTTTKQQPSTPQDPMKEVANMTFAAAAARASALATNEERELTRLVSAAVNAELEKLQLKLKNFEHLEAALHAERLELERGRQQLFLDRMEFRKRVFETRDLLEQAKQKGGEEGAQMAADVKIGSGGGGGGGSGSGVASEERIAMLAPGGEQKIRDARPLDAGADGYSTYEI